MKFENPKFNTYSQDDKKIEKKIDLLHHHYIYYKHDIGFFK
jgi:hypothetical protein